MVKIRKVIRYSESFKQEIIEEYSSGSSSLSELKIKYGISGGNTIANWIKKSAKFDCLPKLIRVETPNDRQQIAELKAEIKRLKMAIADIHLDKVMAECFFETVCDDFNVGYEETKKKIASKVLEKQSKQAKK